VASRALVFSFRKRLILTPTITSIIIMNIITTVVLGPIFVTF